MMSYDSSVKANRKVLQHECKHTALARRCTAAADSV